MNGMRGVLLVNGEGWRASRRRSCSGISGITVHWLF